MKKKIFVVVGTVALLAVAGAIGWSVWGDTDEEMGDYVPSSEFAPAYQALEWTGRTAEANGQREERMDFPDYDIEETVRAMNSLEAAQCQSEDFLDYLEYVARQDFSRVAPDVLEQKRKLFPILQRLFELRKEHAEMDDVWMLMRSATSGAATLADEMNPVGVLGSMLTGDVTLGTLTAGSSMEKAKTAAFDEYERLKDLRGDLEDEIDKVRLAYIDYLESYAPVYYKYMQEWNTLCLKKDKAYIDLYGGRAADAYNLTEDILAQYPNNREALLLKSLSLIHIAQSTHWTESPSDHAQGEVPIRPTDDGASMDSLDGQMVIANCFRTKEITGGAQTSAWATDLYIEAENTLDKYLSLYPGRSAPALVLKGMLCRAQGDNTKAVSHFDHASLEYPRQAEALTDLLDSYKARAYLNKSAEGKYLLRLYRSTMEGFGLFSPNLLKANHHARQGDTDKCKEEIFNHFYRRSNQGVYDCLLSDMQYCEENLYSSFKQILLEQSFLDVAVEPTTNWTLADKDDEIKVTINNRSDIDLENVRVFLCLHYTDMYKDEYDVQKLPSVNIIRHHDKTEIGVVPLNYENKKYNDITRIRAIAMTDDKICWIDNVDYKYMRATQAHTATGQHARNTAAANSVKRQLLDDFHVDDSKLRDILTKGVKVYGAVSDGNVWHDMARDMKNLVSGGDKKLRIELPRILSIIDPVFSLQEPGRDGKALRPTENYLSGSSIRLKFDYTPKETDTIPLYIYSDFATFRITIAFEGGKPAIRKVELI